LLAPFNAPLHAAPTNNNKGAVVAAAHADQLAQVRRLISEHEDVNVPEADGSSALLWATFNSNLEMTKALLAAGAWVDSQNHYGVTPLLQASRLGDVPAMKVLLDAGADPARWHAEGETPLMAASRTGSVEAVKLLLSKGVFINAVDPFQEESALMWASSEGQVDVVNTLLAAGADPNLQAHVSQITERKNADHPSGGFTALMFAARNGHEDVVKALMKGGANPKLANADGLTATMIAIVNDRFDLAKELIDLGADPNDGSLYFAVEMHDGTTDMRAQDATRMQPDHPNKLTALALIKSLMDLGADVNKPFSGAIHSTSMCCPPKANSSPFYKAASASDVEVLKLFLAKGAQIEWTPPENKPKDAKPGPPGPNPNAGKTPLMVAMAGGKGAPIQGGPGYGVRTTPPPFREPGSRQPLEALQVLLDAGANPNAKAADGSTPLHQAVQLQQVAMIRALVAKGAKLDAVNKDNLTPLLAAEKLKGGPDPVSLMGDAGGYKAPKNTKEEVVAALRDLMHLGPNDPAPVPPPPAKKDDKKDDAKKDDKDAKKAPEVTTSTSDQ